jgi:alpha-amylase/alpha-mannosidase (GH57 family)
MHQPQYRLEGEIVCMQPWVRLHASRSYYDMVRVLAEFPDVRVTFNLVPTLLDQIAAYNAGQSDLFRETARLPADALDEGQRRFLVEHFFSAQEERLVRPLPRYAELLDLRREARRRRGEDAAWRDFGPEDLRDLQALFDLAWFGFKAIEDYPEIAALRQRGRGFTPDDVAAIHRVQDDILSRLPGLYREAAARGQAEISASPYAHPILPLVIDSASAREAMPGVALPPRYRAPADARAQISEGLEAVGGAMGRTPAGMWPSEGSVSAAAAGLMSDCGVRWAASDADVLGAAERDGDTDISCPWHLESGAGRLDLVFRDHDLSDRIGFTYAKVEPRTAAAEILAEATARAAGRVGALCLVALDGENPWEHYPDAGAAFLRALYGGLSIGVGANADGAAGAGGTAGATAGPVARTVSEAIALCPRRGTIKRMRPGSWINADFGIWIGGPEKNRAWTLLGEARERMAAPLLDPGTPAAARAAAWRSLRAAEGSDWFWWLDGQFESLYRDDFDRLFRTHLRHACEALGVVPPEGLSWPIAAAAPRRGGRRAAAPAAAVIEPVIDGYETGYFEWYGAARLDGSVLVPASTMQRAERPIECLRYGVTPGGDLVVRIDPGRGAGPAVLRGARVDLLFVRPGTGTLEATAIFDDHGDLAPGSTAGLRARARKVIEIAYPADAAGLVPGGAVILFVRLHIAGEALTLKEVEVRRAGPFPPAAGGEEA